MINRIDRQTITSQNQYWSDIIYDYLSTYLTGLAHESGSQYINFDNKFKLRVVSNIDGTGFVLYLVYADTNEEQIFKADDSAAVYMLENGWFDFGLLKTNDLMIFSILRQYGQSVNILWFKDTLGEEYVGGFMANRNSGSVWMNIEYVYNSTNGYAVCVYNITNINKRGISYFIPKMFNYTLPSGSIDYSLTTPASDNASDSFYIKGIASCTDVTKGSVIILADNSKWLAVSPNHLVNIDEEV